MCVAEEYNGGKRNRSDEEEGRKWRHERETESKKVFSYPTAEDRRENVVGKARKLPGSQLVA